MTTIILEVPNEAEVAKLRQQPGYRVISYVTPALPEPKQPREPRRWAGLLSDADAEALRTHVDEVRNEWERDF